MAVTVNTVVAKVVCEGRRRLVTYQVAPTRFDDQQLAQKPSEYAAVVQTCSQLLAQAATTLPLLRPGQPPALDSERLVVLCRRALEGLVLDLHWAQRQLERLVAEREARQRRGLLAMLRDEVDPHAEALAAAEADVAEFRTAVLSEDNLRAALREMVVDGFVLPRAEGGAEQCYLPGTEAGAGPFHGDVLRAAILAHLEEVRRWNLPAPTPEHRLELAREHCQLLTGQSPTANTMLRDEVKRRLEAHLAAAFHLEDAREEAYQRLLLAEWELPRGPQGKADTFELAALLLPAVTAPDNVRTVLDGLVDEGVLRRWEPAGDEPEYADAAVDWHADEPAPVAVVVTAPTSPTSETPKGSVKERLRLLRELAEEGLITPEEFDRRRQEILAEL